MSADAHTPPTPTAEQQKLNRSVGRAPHTIDMEWMLPGVPPTGKRVETALVVIVGFRDGLVAHEHIYWDQASVLVQLGLLEPGHLPVAGVETTRKVGDPILPSNELIRRAPVSARR
jgi:carboxymethylenebutenolidase